ncbi:MAG: HD-GYP domain-containing protein [Candidatus Omnitrophica bacterium]|nr:HD-GYP domain-containing protein [Candidatus Omnitrophota bacterium]
MAEADLCPDPVTTLTEVGSSITIHQELDQILSIIVEKGARGTRSQVVLIEVQPNELASKPELFACHGVGAETRNHLSQFIPFSRRCYTEKEIVFIKDYRLEKEGAVPEFARSQRIKTLTAVPLRWREKIVGAICFFRTQKEPLTRQEKNFAAALATQTVIAIQQAELVLERQTGYFKTIKILANVIDRKDSYTHGHSARVMEYALMIADRMGLKGKERQEVGDGGYLHDLGKISVDLSILQKPGRLTPQEWERMIIHPQVGAEIVSETEALKELAPIIRHHHEMFSGGGYPDGLTREEIPMGSRIVAVADAYEAMTSDRPYRKGMGREKAVKELRRHAGTQFDPEVVGLFVELI